MDIQEVKRISEVSKEERWPYPRTFQALVDAGVTSYRTEVSDNFTVYMGDEGWRSVRGYEFVDDGEVGNRKRLPR